MSELRPLIDSSDDELELALLRSVQSDAPSTSGLRQTALAVGLSTVTANALASHASASASGLGASASIASAGSSSAAALGSGSLVVLGKGLVGGALISLAALTAVDHTIGLAAAPTAAASVVAAAPPTRAAQAASTRGSASSSTPPADVASPAAAPAPGPAPSAAAERAARADGRGRAGDAAAVFEPEPTQRAPASAAFEPFVGAPSSPAPRPASSSLAAEIRLLDQARAAIANGNFSRAAELLDAYASSRPSSVLAQEAALLRVRLLLGRGDRHAAAVLARRTIAEHPESAHADWLRDTAAQP